MTQNSSSDQLDTLRKQIDKIDEQVLELLGKRIDIVSKVGEIKQHQAPGTCPIRPGREAVMMRHIVKECAKTNLNPAAAAAMWRTLIGACINVETSFTVSIFVPEKDRDLYWLAREYYGPYIQFIRQPHIKRVIGDVMDGKASVGVVPMLHGDDTTFWWTNLLQESNDTPRIFAHLPFVHSHHIGNQAPAALAIGRVPLEETGDDISLLVLEADSNVSHSKLQSAIAQAGIEASWINIATLQPAWRHHLIMLRGFYTLESPAIKSLLSGLGNSVERATFLGTFATPIDLGSEEETTNTLSNAYVAGSNAS